jgi:hypothetical protein
MTRPQAFVVSVEYADMLAITLPAAMEAFAAVFVVTTPTDTDTRAVAEQHGAFVYATDVFSANGAAFNKGAALSLAMGAFAPAGWTAVIDADVIFPGAAVDWSTLQVGCLHVPPRVQQLDPADTIPRTWQGMATVDEGCEYPGYCQVWHADDPVAAIRPRYPVQWKHAGGSDSEFAWRWSEGNRVRLPWSVLHVGPLATNWHGRVNARIDTGKAHPNADARARAQAETRRIRLETRSYGHEQITEADV